MGYCSRVAMVLLVVAMAAAMEGGVLCQYAGSDLEMFVDELPKIPSIRGYGIHHGKFRPRKLNIGMYLKKWKFHRDLPETPVFVYGKSAAEATFPGPTIEALRGVPTYVTWTNHLPGSHILPWDPTVPTAIPRRGGVPTVVHLHGGAHEPASDGNPLAWFTAGFGERGPNWAKTTYTYPNAQTAGNLWYHDHALGLTRASLLAGLLGPYVLRDPPAEAGLGLPSGPEFDRHLVIADRSFNRDGSIYMNYTGNVPAIHPQWQPEYFGDTITVNGKAWPYLAVQRRRYRFRIINVSNARYLRLALSNGMKFTVIGSDTSYLPKPVATADLLVSPGEIYDVVVDFSTCTAAEVELTNDAPYPFPMGSTVSLQLSKVMKFLVAAGPAPCDTSRISKKLSDLPAAKTGEATKRRYIVLYENTTADDEPTQLYINGKRLEDPATETPKSGSTEVWEVINLTGDNHPLHLHLASIQGVEVTELVDLKRFADCMVRLNDAVACDVEAHAVGRRWAVPEYERTWKNIVKIEPGHRTTIVAKFNLVEGNKPYPFDATAEPGYYYHCHILDHEDNAMIRPLKLT